MEPLNAGDFVLLKSAARTRLEKWFVSHKGRHRNGCVVVSRCWPSLWRGSVNFLIDTEFCRYLEQTASVWHKGGVVVTSPVGVGFTLKPEVCRLLADHWKLLYAPADVLAPLQ